jgi:hypothetical protein
VILISKMWISGLKRTQMDPKIANQYQIVVSDLGGSTYARHPICSPRSDCGSRLRTRAG